MARAIDVDRVKREIRKNKEKIVISCKQKYVPLSLIYEILNKAPTLTPPNEWVSVEERLPEDDAPAGRKQITVLVCSKAKKVLVASRIYEPEREYNGKVYPARWRWSKLMNNYVTHWMPLPAPPAKEGD